MLGTVAKKLRLFGYDTFYSSNILGDEILKLAKTEERILITKNEGLVKKSLKQKITNIQITTKKEVEQFFEIKETLGIKKFVIDAENSRCSLCNKELTRVEKYKIINKIPEGVLENNSEFWICKNCQKIYWVGSHFQKLQKFTDLVNDK